MPLQIDFHCHILPGLDHGCRDLETALSQLAMAGQGGTDVLVATSHFYPHRMNMAGFLAKRAAAAEMLAAHLSADFPKVAIGAEVACYPGIENMEGLEQLCIAGTDCLLLEMPTTEWKDAHFEAVDATLERGIRVVLAHIDRYDPKDVEEIMELDVMAQVNASSLDSFFGRRKWKRFFEQGRVWALGSDLHGADKGAYDHFPKALAKLGDETVQHVMEKSTMLLQGATYLHEMKKG